MGVGRVAFAVGLAVVVAVAFPSSGGERVYAGFTTVPKEHG